MNDRGYDKVSLPVSDKGRITELDVLRGFALFGVLLGNFSEFILYGFAATPAQLAALSTAPMDPYVEFFIRLFITDKANTLFAFLFGLGFFLQMQRLSARNDDYKRIYLRRLFVLLIFGIIHSFFIFAWDILHLYALAGFILFAIRGISNRSLLWFGIPFSLFGIIVVNMIFAQFGVRESLGSDVFFMDPSIMERQALAANWNYIEFFEHFMRFTFLDWIIGGGMLGFIFYALGRFMLGVWVGRKGWLLNAEAYLGGFRRWLWLTLPEGFFLELGALALPVGPGYDIAGESLHTIATPLICVGYVCLIVLGLRKPLWMHILSVFAPVGKMALTNYVIGGLVVGMTYYGPKVGMAGHIGLSTVTLITIITFSIQILTSNLWLKYFAFGPLEWVWRSLTYGAMPRLYRRA